MLFRSCGCSSCRSITAVESDGSDKSDLTDELTDIGLNADSAAPALIAYETYSEYDLYLEELIKSSMTDIVQITTTKDLINESFDQLVSTYNIDNDENINEDLIVAVGPDPLA